MQTTIYNPAQNITCFKLENTSWENLYYHALKIGLCESQIDLLKIQYEEVQFKRNNYVDLYINKIYIDYDFIILGTIIDCNNLIAESFHIQLEPIKPVNYLNHYQKEFSVDLTDTEFENYELLSRENNKQLNFKYQSDYLNLQILNSKLNPSDLEYQLDITLHFSEELNTSQMNNLELVNLFYKNRYPVAFYFKDTVNSKTHVAWSSKFIETIIAITPINYDKMDKEEVLNSILDIINTKDIDQLKPSQKKFLMEY